MQLETIQEFVPFGGSYKTPIVSPKPVRPCVVNVKLLEKMVEK
jgi:hypothetical protein